MDQRSPGGADAPQLARTVPEVAASLAGRLARVHERTDAASALSEARLSTMIEAAAVAYAFEPAIARNGDLAVRPALPGERRSDFAVRGPDRWINFEVKTPRPPRKTAHGVPFAEDFSSRVERLRARGALDGSPFLVTCEGIGRFYKQRSTVGDMLEEELRRLGAHPPSHDGPSVPMHRLQLDGTLLGWIAMDARPPPKGVRASGAAFRSPTRRIQPSQLARDVPNVLVADLDPFAADLEPPFLGVSSSLGFLPTGSRRKLSAVLVLHNRCRRLLFLNPESLRPLTEAEVRLLCAIAGPGPIP